MQLQDLCKRVRRLSTRLILPDILEKLLEGRKHLGTSINALIFLEIAQYLLQKIAREADNNLTTNKLCPSNSQTDSNSSKAKTRLITKSHQQKCKKKLAKKVLHYPSLGLG